MLKPPGPVAGTQQMLRTWARRPLPQPHISELCGHPVFMSTWCHTPSALP